MKFIIFFGVLVNGFISPCFAQKLTVGFEPFPPFVTDDGKGLSVDMLRAIEEISDLTFDIKIMTYARVKKELKHQRLDLAGHIPKGIEVTSFYQYAQELNWSILTHTDMFSLSDKYLNVNNQSGVNVATTVGNTGFIAELMGKAPSSFIEVSLLNQLVEMLLKDRVKVIVYERASVMTLLENKGIEGVLYKTVGITPITLAVQKSADGNKLKEKLDSLIKKIDIQKIFANYFRFNQLESEGVTRIENH
ncbi:substrate-binding periplasmic protein [Colwelliaceae bacterium 6441]